MLSHLIVMAFLLAAMKIFKRYLSFFGNSVSISEHVSGAEQREFPLPTSVAVRSIAPSLSPTYNLIRSTVTQI